MITATTPRYINFSELDRWDVKYFSVKIKSKYPLVALATFVHEHNEKVRPFNFPEKTFKILGVNNTDGIFHAYDALGKEIKQPYKKVSAGDFAYNPYRINVGSIGWVPDEHEGAFISPAYVVFSIDENIILPELFWFILKSDFFNKTLRAATAGSVRMNLTSPLLETLKIPIPPLPIQQKIVEYWKGENFNANQCVERSKEINNSIPNYLVSEIGLKPLKQAHSRRAFVPSWKEIERWGVKLAREMTCRPNLSKSLFPIVSLSDVIADLETGWSPKCLNRPANIDEWGTLKLGAISFGKFNENENKALPVKMNPKPQYEVKTGDLLICRGNVPRYVGASALAGEVRTKLMICDLIFRAIWKENSSILPEYLDEIFKIPHLRWQIETRLTGTSPTMKKISKPGLMGLSFPLPPLSIQKKIIAAIASMREESDLLEKKAKNVLDKSTKTVKKLILGTLSVEDL